jgi:hypothetical protein
MMGLCALLATEWLHRVRHARPHPRSAASQGPLGREALCAPDLGERASQSVDTTAGGEWRGRDNAKNVAGRTRPIAVDSMALLLAVLVTAADVDDA